MLTQELLKSFVHYNPDTGIFTYTKTVNPRAIQGQIVGTKQNYGHLYLQYEKRQVSVTSTSFSIYGRNLT